MFGLGNILSPIASLATDVVKIAAAPIAITAEVARAAVEPIAEAADELVDDVKRSLR